MKIVRYVLSALVLSLLCSLTVSARNISSEGYYKNIRLAGRVQVVSSFADLRVQVVQSFPDLKVKPVDSFPDRIGEWQFVDYNPDFTIEFVNHSPDIRIRFVSSFPGVV